ncbi:MAG: class I SAM-dependent methyltransferase [Kordiimonadaceae bacterium]|nr:class I SAM-dependent methyltransferase [Kordiimonadaceae bacterium]
MNKQNSQGPKESPATMARAFWNDRFGTADYAYGTTPNDFLKGVHHHILPAGKILCAAEGEGRNAVFLAQNNFSVSAVDISAEGKKKTERLASEHQVSIDYTVCDLDLFDLGESQWDAIVSIFGFIGTCRATRKPAFERIYKALKPGGVLIVEAYHPRQIEYKTGGPKDPDLLIALDELKSAFKIGRILHQTELERKVVEGSFHTGNAHVTQFVYVKPA